MLKITTSGLSRVATDAIVIPVCEDQEIHSSDEVLNLIKEAKKIKEFQGRKTDRVTLYHPARLKARRVVFMGLGKEESIKSESFRSLAGSAVRKAIQKDLGDVVFAAPDKNCGPLPADMAIEALLEGACLGNHLSETYKQKKDNHPLKRIRVAATTALARKTGSLPDRIQTVCAGTILARNWVTLPPNRKKPEQLVRLIVSAAKKEKLNTHVLEEKELKKLGMDALLAVAAGSGSKAKLVILEHTPKGIGKPTVLVGKGVTFDSGGINLKPSASLEDMKMDMAGAAAVAATLITLARLGSGRKVIGVIPVVENMPSGNATRPGDIVSSHSGKSIEIGNTDAEGRLILVDALSYAIERYKPEMVIDLATLTGACIMALGEKIAGLFSTDDALAEKLQGAGEKIHERCWRMPLPKDYKELVKSDLADIKNLASSRWGGAITAALFLSEFVTVDRWAHIDIAGPAFAKKEGDYCPAGGTGFGVRLLCELLV